MTDARVLDLAASRMAVVLNKAAGRKDALAREEALCQALTPRVRDYATYAFDKGSAIAAAAERAVRDGADIVVALGGDGTQSAVAGALAGALAGSQVVMGVLPGGTFNYFARDLGVGETVEAATETLLAGHVRRLDVGEVNGRIFLNNASFGVYPEILRRREAIYRRWGRSRVAAYWSVLLTLRDLRAPMHLRLTLDGVVHEVDTPLAFAARSAFQLESLGLEGAEAIRDGQFALFLAKGHKPLHLMAAAFRMAFGTVAKGQDFDLLMADEIEIATSRQHRLVAFDGEKKRIDGPFRLRIHRAALSVIAPAPEAGTEAGPKAQAA